VRSRRSESSTSFRMRSREEFRETEPLCHSSPTLVAMKTFSRCPILFRLCLPTSNHRSPMCLAQFARPSFSADMQQRVHHTNIDERPIISEASHCAADRVARPQFGVAPVLNRLLFLFHHNASIDDNIFICGVEFDDATACPVLEQSRHPGRNPP